MRIATAEVIVVVRLCAKCQAQSKNLVSSGGPLVSAFTGACIAGTGLSSASHTIHTPKHGLLSPLFGDTQNSTVHGHVRYLMSLRFCSQSVESE